MRLLVAEDEKNLNKLISKKLIAEGYSVDSCFDGEEAKDYLAAASFDGVILDIMMPRMDGLALLRHMRGHGDLTPVLFLTARDAVEDKVTGLDLGASDYLVKPFSFAELMARIRVLTRKNTQTASAVYQLSDLQLDTASRKVSRGGVPISLSAKEFSLLEYLMRNQGVVLSREKIENNLWNFDYEGGTNAVDVYIRYLRKKVDEPFDKKLIHTVRGVGYVLREEDLNI
ncbi:MAG: response regulator transcription factor [Firmicutes bacterium]|nr:response regulator transcription factor [Bacillota bacterium]